MKTYLKMILMAVTLFISTQSAYAIICNSGISNSFTSTGAIDHREKCLIKVKNGLGSTIARGTLASLDLTADDGITVTTSANLAHQPLCMIDESCANGKMCKCQVYGYTSVLLLDNTRGDAVAGGLLYRSDNTAGYVNGPNDNSATSMVVGYALDATTASGAVEAYLKLQ